MPSTQENKQASFSRIKIDKTFHRFWQFVCLEIKTMSLKGLVTTDNVKPGN